jgi:hypothetical protein
MAEPLAVNPDRQSDPSELEYRSVEPLAIWGLALGLLSPAALLSPVLWLVPLIGIAANAMALRRLSREGNRAGRPAALMGLGLAVLFGMVPIARMTTDYVLLKEQPRELADRFLEYLRQDDPRRALMLRAVPDVRKSLDDDEAVRLFFRNNVDARSDLAQFVHLPVARTLLALGQRAQIRYYGTMGVGSVGDRALVHYWYTVTFDDEQGNKKTFFVGLTMERKPTRNPELNPWRVQDFVGPIDPYNR